jgi:HEPN domain-containing protein
MKGQTSVLLDIAKSDLDLAKKALPDDPANAAFHAQQCSEKAVKAVAFELGPYEDAKDFERIAKKLGHDSTRACFAVIRTIIVRQEEGSGLEEELTNLKRLKEEGNQDALLAYGLGMLFKIGLQKVLEPLDRSPVENTENYWIRSLDPSLAPRPTISEKWKMDLAEGMNEVEDVWKIMAAFLGIENSKADELFDSSTDISQELRMFEQMEEILRSRDMIDAANQVQVTRVKIGRLLGPNYEFVSWLGLVVSWTRYLDAHAEKGRYQDAVQRKTYREHVSGVQNLVGKAEDILEQTRLIIPLLSGDRI